MASNRRQTKIFEIFTQASQAILDGVLIRQVSSTDKEFHFQNWFQARMDACGVRYDRGGRNTYPDFALVEYTEGFEIKGLAYPGRESSYDSNSQVPTGFHNGRDIFYVFGRYPPTEDAGKVYPVIDLVICHGDFLNADHDYVHKNKSVKGFGSYGDIMIRDRKMYVAPTPYAIANGFTGTRTLVIPVDWRPPKKLKFKPVGNLERVEAQSVVVGYAFDLKTNAITPTTIPNPSAGKVHTFVAYRMAYDSDNLVTLNGHHADASVADEEV
ncbi:MAG TPA: hypothetical protein PLE92_09960 [Lentisphaeria bacterium]|nr:hypothetical protein [Lentisphaeria bacterium]